MGLSARAGEDCRVTIPSKSAERAILPWFNVVFTRVLPRLELIRLGSSRYLSDPRGRFGHLFAGSVLALNAQENESKVHVNPTVYCDPSIFAHRPIGLGRWLWEFIERRRHV